MAACRPRRRSLGARAVGPPSMQSFVLSSRLRAPAERVWAHLFKSGAVLDPGCDPWPRTSTVTARSLLVRTWHHERLVRDDPAGCEVRDSIEFEPASACSAPGS